MNRKSETEEVLDENEQDIKITIKTIFIYSDFMDLPRFFFKEGDYSHLDGTVINSYEPDEDKNKELEIKQNELLVILFGKKLDYSKIDVVLYKTYHEASLNVIEDPHITISVGFNP